MHSPSRTGHSGQTPLALDLVWDDSEIGTGAEARSVGLTNGEVPDLADETALMWARLRERRFSLRDGPLLKDSSSRRNSLGAAMTQFEEQMTAAGVVSSVTRPINLYYALVQAGLAITATHTPGTYTFSSHGLKIVNPEAELSEIMVNVDAKRDRGGYEIVSRAVGSDVIESEVPVGALWASLPDLTITPLPDSGYPKVVTIIPSFPYDPPDYSNNVTIGTTVIPRLYDSLPHASIYVSPGLVPAEPTDKWVRELLAPYPGTENCVLYAEEYSAAIKRDAESVEVNIAWPRTGGRLTKDEAREFFAGIAPAYRYEMDRYLRPSVERQGKKPPTPLMTWWLLLYVFSMMSRYQPAKWTKLLDLDRSKYAVPLQYALQEAISVLPHLVLEGLDNQPWLLPKAMMFSDD